MGKHALIIEDDPVNAEVLAFMLSAEHVTSTTISNPALVRDIVPELPAIDVVFLDLEMPGLNGYDVLRMLKDDLGIEAPVVACTVHTSQIDIARMEGFHSFLGKPLMAEQFSGQLSQILNGKSVWIIP
jgi:two-component system chemotaxis sensor kinase CheA